MNNGPNLSGHLCMKLMTLRRAEGHRRRRKERPRNELPF